MSENIYRQHDESCVDSPQYLIHVDRMTRENLRSKSDIAAELAARDIRIAELKAELAEAREAIIRAPCHQDSIPCRWPCDNDIARNGMCWKQKALAGGESE